MMHQRPCPEVRERLEEFHDGELPIDEQVAIQGHLGECVACGLAAAELAELRASLRLMTAELTQAEREEERQLTANVVERLRVEAQFSLAAQLRSLFQDMHLVWAGLGATLATVICLIGSMSVLHAASKERPDSLAGVINVLANPGSNANPLRLDAEMMAPRARAGVGFEMSEEDAVFALVAVLTREGRLQNIEVLAAEQSKTLRVRPEVVLAMLDQASRAQFEPAQARGGHTVAVSMVWLLTSTTVVGRHDDSVPFMGRPWRTPQIDLVAPQPEIGPPAVPQNKPSSESLELV